MLVYLFACTYTYVRLHASYPLYTMFDVANVYIYVYTYTRIYIYIYIRMYVYTGAYLCSVVYTIP